MTFKDRFFIVTGASSGMGKSCCELLLENEAVVAGIDVNDSTIEDLTRTISLMSLQKSRFRNAFQKSIPNTGI